MSSIPLHRRLEYARGYIELGLIKEASDELETIGSDASTTTEVQRVRIDLYMEAKQWDNVVGIAPAVCEATPTDEGGWIAWAYALRELQRVEEAQNVLRKAEPLHGATCSVMHYNLACYACLLGDFNEARRRLSITFKMGKHWKQSALEDPDLRNLWNDIAGMK